MTGSSGLFMSVTADAMAPITAEAVKLGTIKKVHVDETDFVRNLKSITISPTFCPAHCLALSKVQQIQPTSEMTLHETIGCKTPSGPGNAWLNGFEDRDACSASDTPQGRKLRRFSQTAEPEEESGAGAGALFLESFFSLLTKDSALYGYLNRWTSLSLLLLLQEEEHPAGGAS
eukprot:CAMPEP_0181301456 /NCGR_PEP_ID=MMETSP1101-20121128/7434_1 /TAXON_ID=46948 /ORGANISM="Rhodomonas abbreviata, Strain Caron Lab Isolate" /LENGTH=173 /DNA_ID=CAMNT_0023406763 /DNA_START=239 /DNA_END=758 /DNA_ORIENTATION=-